MVDTAYREFRWQTLFLALILALAALAAYGHERRATASELLLLTCNDDDPYSVWVLNAASASACDGTEGSVNARCCCADGSWASCGGGGSPDIDSVTGQSSWDTAATKKTADLTFDAVEADFDNGAAPGYPLLSNQSTCASAACDSAAEIGRLCYDTDGDSDGQGTTMECDSDGEGGWQWNPVDDGGATTEHAPYEQYDPDNPPTSVGTGGWKEEFTGDTAGGTSSWSFVGNADVTKSFVLDSMRLVIIGDSTAIDRYLGTVAAPSGSWTLYAKANVGYVSASIGMCGLVAIHTGTQAAPTDLTQLIAYESGNQKSAAMQTATSLTSATSPVGSAAPLNYCAGCSQRVYYRLTYDAAADTLTGCIGLDGFKTIECPARTSVTSDPLYLGIMADDLASVGSAVAVDCFYEWIRLRTDATGNADPFPSGE